MANPATPDRSALEKIAGWAKAEPGVTIAADGTLTVAGERPLDLTVAADDERVTLTHHHRETGADAARVTAVRAALPGRGSGITTAVAAAGTDLEVAFTSTLYVDGMTRQGFVRAFNDLIAAVDRLGGPFAPTTRSQAAAAPAAAVPAEPVSSGAPADASPTMVLSPVWSPTHRVPAGGLRAWGQPDPALEPVATLQARVELSIAERRADWARVVGSNGWTGWVDARRLEPMVAGGTAPAKTAAAASGFPLGAFGAVALIAAAFLPWFDVSGFTLDSFDVALPFLWDLEASGDPALGFAVVAAGALGLAALFLKGVPEWVRRLAGILGAGAAAVFAFQVNRGLGTGLGDTIDTIGYGVYVALAGAVVLFAAPRAGVTKS